MNAIQLKNSILQYAMQGKLVPQNPKDEPASLLLEQINDEKEHLIKNKVIKKEKPSPPITDDEIPYDIPNSWEWIRLKDISIINPKNKADDELESGFVPMKLIDEGFSNKHIFENKAWGMIKKGYTHFQNNDIAIAKITPCFENKKSMILRGLPNGIGAGTTELFIVRTFQNVCLEYLLYLFKTQSFIKEGVESFTGTAGQQRVSKSFLENYLFGMPPLAEQQRIVEKVEELFSKVDEYNIFEQELTKLNFNFPNDMENSILQYAMNGKLVEQDPSEEPVTKLLERIKSEKKQLVKNKVMKRDTSLDPIHDEEIPYEIPESWAWVKFGDIFEITSSKRVHQSDWRTEGIPFYRAREIVTISKSGSVNNELFIETEMYETFVEKYGVPKSNDILVTGVGTLGVTYVVREDDKFYFKDGNIIWFKNHFKINADYIDLLFKSTFLKEQIHKSSMGTTVGTYTIIRAKNTIIPLPPLAEQQRIVDRVDELVSKFKILKTTINIKKTGRKGFSSC